MSGGIIYEYEDGGSYCGELDGDRSHGLGVCTGPNGEGTFEGRWEFGNQVSGVYRWPSGVQYSGTWEDNVRHGMGVESRPDGTEYSGDFTRGTRGPFGVAQLPNGVYQGQWARGAQDGEGVETYRDKGCYRGQYKKGLRCGFGTRSSSAYEVKGGLITTSNSEPTLVSLLKRSKLLSDQRLGSLKKSNQKHQESTSSLTFGPTSGVSTPTQVSGKDDAAQVYEGEWLDDKRHGHGILKVLGHYTYYGQWSHNARTGHGVLMYENGTKEEGEWHNGTLVAVARRSKILVFKSQHLESRVKEAHTKALQVAETARAKADLAIGRAGTAVNHSKQALRVAERARTDARDAIVRAEQYKNAPTVSEAANTPMYPPSGFPNAGSERSLSSQASSSVNAPTLTASDTIVPSTSFEDLQTDSGLPRARGSDSPGSQRQEYHHSNDSLISVDEGVSLHSNTGSRERRRRLYDQTSSSEHSFDGSEVNTRRPRRISDSAVGQKNRRQKMICSYSLSDHEEEDKMMVQDSVQRSLRQRIDKRTGEVDQGEVSEHEADTHEKSGMAVRSSQQGVAPIYSDTMINMLNQMTRWNRIVAMLNFGLLLLLLLLIVAVFLSMHYYHLISYYQNQPDPEDQPRPARSFITPLA